MSLLTLGLDQVPKIKYFSSKQHLIGPHSGAVGFSGNDTEVLSAQQTVHTTRSWRGGQGEGRWPLKEEGPGLGAFTELPGEVLTHP